MRKVAFSVVLFAMLASGLAGCGSGSSRSIVLTPTAAPTSAPTLIPTGTPTPIPSPTVTVVPTSSPTSSSVATGTPTPSSVPSPTPSVAPTSSSTATRTPTSTPTPPPPLACTPGTAIGPGTGPVLALSGANQVELAYGTPTITASGIMFASSPDLGKTWSAPVTVVDDGDQNMAPSIAADAAGNTWISWLDLTSGLIKISATKDGAKFSPPVTIVASGATPATSAPFDSLALDRTTGTLLMATTGKSTGSNPILMRSTDLGLTWSAGATFSGAGSPSVVVGNANQVYLTSNVPVTVPGGSALQRNIYVSGDDGLTFSYNNTIRTSAPGNTLVFTPASLIVDPAFPDNYAEFGAEAHAGTPGTLASFVSNGITVTLDRSRLSSPCRRRARIRLQTLTRSPCSQARTRFFMLDLVQSSRIRRATSAGSRGRMKRGGVPSPVGRGGALARPGAGAFHD